MVRLRLRRQVLANAVVQLACNLLPLHFLNLAQADGQRTELAALLANGRKTARFRSQ